MMVRFLKGIRNLFVQSSKIHLRTNPVGDTHDLINLIDRFLDGPLNYDLEWDDFISWKNNNAHVESIRERLSEFEPLLFSKNRDDRLLYRKKVIEERNRIARLLSIGVRDNEF